MFNFVSELEVGETSNPTDKSLLLFVERNELAKITKKQTNPTGLETMENVAYRRMYTFALLSSNNNKFSYKTQISVVVTCFGY